MNDDDTAWRQKSARWPGGTGGALPRHDADEERAAERLSPLPEKDDGLDKKRCQLHRGRAQQSETGKTIQRAKRPS